MSVATQHNHVVTPDGPSRTRSATSLHFFFLGYLLSCSHRRARLSPQYCRSRTCVFPRRCCFLLRVFVFFNISLSQSHLFKFSSVSWISARLERNTKIHRTKISDRGAASFSQNLIGCSFFPSCRLSFSLCSSFSRFARRNGSRRSSLSRPPEGRDCQPLIRVRPCLAGSPPPSSSRRFTDRELVAVEESESERN